MEDSLFFISALVTDFLPSIVLLLLSVIILVGIAVRSWRSKDLI